MEEAWAAMAEGVIPAGQSTTTNISPLPSAMPMIGERVVLSVTPGRLSTKGWSGYWSSRWTALLMSVKAGAEPSTPEHWTATAEEEARFGRGQLELIWTRFVRNRAAIIGGGVVIVLYLIAVCFGVAVHYSIMLSLAAVSFWIVRAQGLVYGYFNFLNIARYPDSIFPRLFKFVFSWIVPVVVVSNVPARVLAKSLDQPWGLMAKLIIASTVIFCLSRSFWSFALRRYSSASS